MKELKRISVNILGGRDVGKSAVAMHVAAELRWLGIPTALTCGGVALFGYGALVVDIRIHDVPVGIWTPHALAEMCRDTMTFLVRRSKDYAFGSIKDSWETIIDDEKLEGMVREGRVQYKSLPGVRGSVPYIIDRICKEIGYGK